MMWGRHAEWDSKHHGGQEAERECLLLAFSFSLLYSFWSTPYERYCPLSGWVLPPHPHSDSLLEIPHGHTRRCALLISSALVNPIKLTTTGGLKGVIHSRLRSWFTNWDIL
jgi:hypothetical protein